MVRRVSQIRSKSFSFLSLMDEELEVRRRCDMRLAAGYVLLLLIAPSACCPMSGQMASGPTVDQGARQTVGNGGRLLPSEARSDAESTPDSNLGVGVFAPILTTQTPAATAVPQSAAAALARMAALAGVIFAGEVTAVRRPIGYAGSPQSAAEGIIEVEFRVDAAVRGAMAGSVFVLKEWAGLWAGGIDRYQVGERLLLFLHAPNAQGMSSPIDGMDGAVPLAGNGTAVGARDGFVAAGTWMVDLRWLQAQVLRGSVPERGATPMRDLSPSHAAVEAVEGTARGPGSPVSWRAVSAMPQASSTEALETVLSLCQQWEQQSNAAR
jgi:hypothetical protein